MLPWWRHLHNWVTLLWSIRTDSDFISVFSTLTDDDTPLKFAPPVNPIWSTVDGAAGWFWSNFAKHGFCQFVVGRYGNWNQPTEIIRRWDADISGRSCCAITLPHHILAGTADEWGIKQGLVNYQFLRGPSSPPGWSWRHEHRSKLGLAATETASSVQTAEVHQSVRTRAAEVTLNVCGVNRTRVNGKLIAPPLSAPAGFGGFPSSQTRRPDASGRSSREGRTARPRAVPHPSALLHRFPRLPPSPSAQSYTWTHKATRGRMCQVEPVIALVRGYTYVFTITCFLKGENELPIISVSDLLPSEFMCLSCVQCMLFISLSWKTEHRKYLL